MHVYPQSNSPYKDLLFSRSPKQHKNTSVLGSTILKDNEGSTILIRDIRYIIDTVV